MITDNKYLKETMDNIKPTVAICCGTCKHADKKITEEPCWICSPWCDKWTEKEVEDGEDNKM